MDLLKVTQRIRDRAVLVSLNHTVTGRYGTTWLNSLSKHPPCGSWHLSKEMFMEIEAQRFQESFSIVFCVRVSQWETGCA